MIKPRAIPKGLRIECYLYVSNEESTENEYKQLFQEAKSNGSLAECIKNAWNLASVPNIINLKIKDIGNKSPKSDQNTQKKISENIIEMGEQKKAENEKEDMDVENNSDSELRPNVPRAITANDSMIEFIGEHD